MTSSKPESVREDEEEMQKKWKQPTAPGMEVESTTSAASSSDVVGEDVLSATTTERPPHHQQQQQQQQQQVSSECPTVADSSLPTTVSTPTDQLQLGAHQPQQQE